MAEPDASTRSRSGALVAGRYTLGDTIGYGGASVVYAATDDVTDRPVAVKLLNPGVSGIEDRARREIAALRLLRLPGVVTLQDEGDHDGAPFLVMELVDGRPFPGCPTPASWRDLAAPTLSMLETLARVHAAGVVHRDLKPSNVFVGEELRVTLLDFGISWGPALGEALTAVGGIVGTPEYLAPEQLAGIRGDPRSDLYTVGILLYEALTAALPHKATTFGELSHLKLHVTPRSVRELAPDTPRRVAQTVERLLSRDPENRPQSVGELLHQLYDREVTRRLTSVLPRLGPPEIVESVTARVLAGESVDVTGPLGTGRSRLVTDVAERLTAEGRTARWVPPGTAPFSCALALLDDIGDTSELSRDELERQLLDGFVRQRDAGTVVLVDDPRQIDDWSAELFERAVPDGGFVRVVDEPTDGCVTLTRLTEVDLRPLFAGPDRIFHLREDGAAELFRRTGGLPSRVADELGAWVRAGLARWHDGEVVISRDALQRLAGGLPIVTSSTREEPVEPDSPGLQELLVWITLAWPHTSEDVLAHATDRPRWRLQPELDELVRRRRITRLDDGRYQPIETGSALRLWSPDRLRDAHRSLADSLEPGTPDRLRHLTVSGSAREVIDESLRRGEALRRRGRYTDAIVAIEQGLVAARREGDTTSELRLLVLLAEICLDDDSPGVIQQGLYDIGRALDRGEEVSRLEELLLISRDVESAPPDGLLERLEQLGPFEDLTLELWRRAQQFRLSFRLGPAVEADTMRAIEEWADATGDDDTRRSVARWRALHLQHAGQPLEAARLHEAALVEDDSAAMRFADRLNAAQAFIDAGDLEKARELAGRARQEAAARRAAVFEAMAEAMLRHVAYRQGEDLEPDEELLDLVAQLAGPAVEGHASITEAAIAWRNGDLETGRRIAARCTELCKTYAEPGCDALLRALEIVCGASYAPDELQSLESTVRETPDPELAVQTLGLLAIHQPEEAERLQGLAGARIGELTYDDPAVRCVVLSIEEAAGGNGPPDAEEQA
jgi:hypothetical protein